MSNLNLLSPFHLRFKDKLSMIGKDGVNGLLKQTKLPIEPLDIKYSGLINETKTNKTSEKLNKAKSFLQSQPYPKIQNTYFQTDSSNINFSTIPKYNQTKKITTIPINSPKSSTLSRSHDPHAYYRLLCDNSFQTLPKIKSNVYDTSINYVPYTIKDYRSINKKENFELSKLGPNIYTESWKKRFRKNSKVKDYSNSLKEENLNHSREQSARTRKIIQEYKDANKNNASSSFHRKSSYGRRVENLRIGVNLSPYIIYNNKRKLKTLKEELNKSIDKNYILENKNRPESKIRFSNTNKDYLQRQLLLKGNIRENILNKYKNSLI